MIYPPIQFFTGSTNKKNEDCADWKKAPNRRLP